MPILPAIAPSDITTIAFSGGKAGKAGASALNLNATPAKAEKSFLTFPLASLPANSSVITATLKFTISKAWAGTKSITLTAIAEQWVSTTTKWSAQPAVRSADPYTSTAPTGWSSSGSGAAKTTITIDVTNHIKLATTGTQWFGWVLETTSTSQNIIYGKGSSGPTLTIEYATGPKQPTKLTPGSGSDPALIANDQPTLSTEGDLFFNGNSVQAIQVQISSAKTLGPSGDFHGTAGFIWDSTPKSTTTTSLALSSISGSPTAAANQTLWWTARLQSTGTNQWSPYGAPVAYTYKPQGTLAITNPPISPAVVSDSTPLITWTLTGQTQALRQVALYDPDDNFSLVWQSPIEPTSVQSLNIDPGYLVTNNKYYRVVVKVWDTFYNTRQDSYEGTNSSPAPPFVIMYRDFQYQLDAGTAPVTNLVATDNSPKPYITLTWSRSVTPDTFELVRDGEIIDYDLTPIEAHQSGTNYSWIDYFPSPGTPHSYEVRAKVGSNTSAANTVVYANNTTSMAWLADVENNIFIAISGETPVDPNLTEVGTTFSLLNSPYDVRITSALRGYSGSVSGGLCGECVGDGTTSEDLQDALLQLRATPGKRLHLSIGNISVPVVIYDVSTFPRYGPEFGHVYGVTFNWHQVA